METTAFNQHKWPAAYSAYTAKYKAKCPYATFAKKNAALAKQFPGPRIGGLWYDDYEGSTVCD